MSNVTRTIVFGDVHAPNHDNVACTAFIAAIKQIEPHKLVCVGDFLDCAAVNPHDGNNARAAQSTILEEAGEALTLLKRINAAAPDYCQKHFIEGNHEHWISRYLNKHTAMYGLTSVQSLLSLKCLGWKHTPYGGGITVGDIYCTHTFKYLAAGAARANAGEAFGSVIVGHSHRLEHLCMGSVRGSKPVDSLQCGWLGDPDKAAPYELSTKVRRWWAHGFVLIEHNGSKTYPRLVRIVDGKVRL